MLKFVRIVRIKRKKMRKKIKKREKIPHRSVQSQVFGIDVSGDNGFTVLR